MTDRHTPDIKALESQAEAAIESGDPADTQCFTETTGMAPAAFQAQLRGGGKAQLAIDVASYRAGAHAMPAHVMRFISFHVGRLQEASFALQGVQRARGSGHHLALELEDRRPTILASFAALADVRSAAQALGRGSEEHFGAVLLSMDCPDFSPFGLSMSADTVLDAPAAAPSTEGVHAEKQHSGQADPTP